MPLRAALALVTVLVVPAPAEAYVRHLDLSYDIDSPPAAAEQNLLDLYSPAGARRGSRPVVVWVHGGGWQQGDKQNQIRWKADLFTREGYLLASVNYRLSGLAPPVGPFDPGRIRFPDHPHDVGEAIAWLHRHVARYGGDPTRILVAGHSSGAHVAALVAVDPRYLRAYRVPRSVLLGAVSLDTAALDVARLADPGRNEGARGVWSVFGTPDENAASGSWAAASPLRSADASDPPFLQVIQHAAVRARRNQTRRMALRLGQGSDSVLQVPLNHAGINRSLGAPWDRTLETSTVTRFVRDAVAAARPTVSIRRIPHTRVAFRIRVTRTYLRLECRRDAGRFRRCGTRVSYRPGPGGHTLAVRALAPDGRAGPVTRFRFVLR